MMAADAIRCVSTSTGGAGGVVYSQFRISVTATQGGQSFTVIPEVDFLDAGVSLIGSGTPIASSQINTTNSKEKAFDGSLGTWWRSVSGLPQSIGYNFGVDTAIDAFSITSDGYSLSLVYAPTAFTLQGYDGAEWVDIADYTTGSWGVRETRTFNV